MIAPLLLVAGLLAQTPDTSGVQAWRDLWRRPFDSSLVTFHRLVQRARASGDKPLLGSIFIGLGLLTSRKGGIAPALAWFDSATRIGPTDNPLLEPQIRCIRATIMTFGGVPGAMAEARLGLVRANQARNDSARGWCLHAVGTVALNESNDPATVLALLDSAIAVERDSGDDDMLGIELFTRGYLLQAIGDLAGAKRDLAVARQLAVASGNRFTQAYVHRFLGDIHLSTSDWVSAGVEYRAALKDFTYLGDQLGLRGIKRVMASADLGAGHLDAAEGALRETLKEAETAGMAEGVYFSLLELATVRWLKGDFEGSRAETERAAAYGLRTGHQAWVQQLGYNRGLYALRMGRLGPAEQYLRSWLKDIAPTVIGSRYSARARLAEVLVRQGRLQEGFTEISAAMDQLDSLRHSTEDRALRTLIFQARSTVDEPDLGLATIVAALVRAGRTEDAFALSERRRARMLGERLLRDRLAAPGTRAGGAPHEALARIQSAEVRAGLPPGSALIEYLAGRQGQPTVAFILTREAVTAEILPTLDSLSGDADRLVALLAAGESADAPSRNLGRALLQPVLARLPAGITTLHVVPDGLLQRLPLDALILSDGRALLERFIVSVVPSAAVALTLHRRPRNAGTGGVLAFGDPRFADEASSPSDITQAVYREAFDSSGGLPRLPASAGEARNAARYSPNGEFRLRAAASEAFLKRVPKDRFQVIHFATHALVDERSSARTALALAPGEGEDGFVGPGELAALGLGADLVVLSACRTAGGAEVEGEGIQGLTAPLLEGGARSVVATMWPVADQMAAAMISEFYAGLARGLAVGEALRSAKLARKAAGATSGEWAAFVVIGDPLLTIPLREPPPSWPRWLLVGALAATGLVLVLRRFRAGSASLAAPAN